MLLFGWCDLALNVLSAEGGAIGLRFRSKKGNEPWESTHLCVCLAELCIVSRVGAGCNRKSDTS